MPYIHGFGQFHLAVFPRARSALFVTNGPLSFLIAFFTCTRGSFFALAERGVDTEVSSAVSFLEAPFTFTEVFSFWLACRVCKMIENEHPNLRWLALIHSSEQEKFPKKYAQVSLDLHHKMIENECTNQRRLVLIPS